jgi:hypothetical protein
LRNIPESDLLAKKKSEDPVREASWNLTIGRQDSSMTNTLLWNNSFRISIQVKLNWSKKPNLVWKAGSKLSEFERENGIESGTFYERYEKGELGDDLKYLRWAGEYETLKRLEKDYEDLQGIELCS